MIRRFAAAGLMIALFGTLAVQAAPPEESGSIRWQKSYPNVTPKGVELAGTITVGEGWKATDCQAVYCPAKGGQASAPVALKIVDGKWGSADAGGKFEPAKLRLDKGKWTISVTVVFEKVDAQGVFKRVTQTPGEPTIEVK